MESCYLLSRSIVHVSKVLRYTNIYVQHLQVHRHWRNRLQAASGVALESYCKQVIRCVTIALDCVEGDRRKRPTIGTIVSQLNEVDVMCPFPDALRNDPESSAEQVFILLMARDIGFVLCSFFHVQILYRWPLNLYI